MRCVHYSLSKSQARSFTIGQVMYIPIGKLIEFKIKLVSKINGSINAYKKRNLF